MTARVTLIGKPGCHLCDEARAVVAKVTAELGLEFDELSILDDDAGELWVRGANLFSGYWPDGSGALRTRLRARHRTPHSPVAWCHGRASQVRRL